MRSPRETGRRITVTRNKYGFSIQFTDKNPHSRYLPLDPRDVNAAFKHAKYEDLPKYDGER